MAAASLTIGTIGRGIQFGNLSGILVTVVASATTYSAAGGGLPIDLTTVLQQAAPAGWDAPNYTQALNPADVVCLVPMQLSTAGYLPQKLVVGTPTYTAVPGTTAGNGDNVPGILATCPATIQLWGTGASNAAALAQVADGSNSDTVTFLMIVMRNGANN